MSKIRSGSKTHTTAHSDSVRAAKVLLLLAARNRKTVTYGTLMKRVGLSRGRALSGMIGVVDRMEYASHAPGFAAIIVRKDTGFPGGGYFCDDTLPAGLRRSQSRASDPRLSGAERDHVRRKQEEIWRFYGRGGHSVRR